MNQNNVLTLDDVELNEVSGDNLQDPTKKENKQKDVLTLDDISVSNKDVGVTKPVENSFISSSDYTTDYTTFDQLRVGADNKERRAKQQGYLELAGKSAVQTLGIAVGSTIKGFGYLGDLVTDLPNLMRGEEVQFDNLVSQIGTGIEEGARDIAPIYQTADAQKGGVNAFSDPTWWASRAPDIATTLAILIPGYAAMRGLGALAKLAKGIQAVNKAGKTIEKISPTVSNIMNNRRAAGLVNHTGNTFLSRHIENSMESDGLFKEVYEEGLAEGLSDEEARAKAGKASATRYRLGYANIWQDALQWKILLGTKFGSEAAKGAFFTKVGTNPAAKRTMDYLTKKFPNGPTRQAIRKTGIAGKKGMSAIKEMSKLGLLEAFEEVNQEHQNALAKDYVDTMEGNVGEPSTGWYDIYSNLAPNYIEKLGEFIYDEDTLISDKAFDSAFWGFMGGAVMGGAFKGAKPFLDKLEGRSEATEFAKQKKRFEYLKTQAGAMEKALSEQDTALAEKLRDEATFSLVQSALSESRLSDLKDSLEGIVNADKTTLENSGLPSSDQSRGQFEKMLADVDYIEKQFDKNYKTNFGFGDHYDRMLATRLTEHEYMQMRLKERLSDIQSQKQELKTSINDSVLSDEYKPLLDYRLEQQALKNGKKQLKYYISQAKKGKENYEGDKQQKERKIREYELQVKRLDARISSNQESIKEFKNGIESDTQQEQILESIVSDATELSDVLESEEIHNQQLETVTDNLRTLYTKEGQKKHIDELKKRMKENVNSQKQAIIRTMDTMEELNKVDDISDYTQETQQLYKDKVEQVRQRDRAVKNTTAPDVDQTLIEEVDSKVPFQSQSEYENFISDIDNRELHGNTKNALKKYAEDVYTNTNKAVSDVVNQQQLRDLKNKLSKDHKPLIDKVFSSPTLNDAMGHISSADIDGNVKREITRVAKNFFDRITKKVPKEQQEKFDEINQNIEEQQSTKVEPEYNEGDYKKVEELAKRTAKGEDITSVENLQLITNYPKLYEKYLNDLQQSKDDEIVGTITVDEDIDAETTNVTTDELDYTEDKQTPSNVMSARDQVKKGTSATNSQWYHEAELQKDDSIKITNRTDSYERHPDVDYHEQSNPNVKQGDEVTLRLIKNDWVNSDPENQSLEKHSVGIYHNDFDNPIGIIRRVFPENAKDGRRKAELENELNQRKDIVSALKAGKQVKATINKKKTGVNNINNMRIDGQPFIQSIKNLESNQLTRKSDGSIIREDRPVILVTSTGTVESGDRRLEIESAYYDFLDPSTINEINQAISAQELTTEEGVYMDGHVWMVTLNPYGSWQALKVATRNLDKKAVNKAYDLLTDGDLDNADHIVSINSSVNMALDQSLYLSAYETENSFTIEYFDNNLNDVVKLVKNENKKGFTAYRRDQSEPTTKNEMDHLVFQFETTPLKTLNYKDGLQKLFANKKYNVDRFGMGDINNQYTSPLFDKTFDSYYDYLTAEETVSVTGSNTNTSAILGTDIYSENGSLWNNIMMELEPKIGKSKPKSDNIVRPTKEKATPKKRRSRKRTSPFDVAAEEQYNKYEDTFKESGKFVTLEDFKHEAAKGGLSPEYVQKFAESIVQKIKNNC